MIDCSVFFCESLHFSLKVSCVLSSFFSRLRFLMSGFFAYARCVESHSDAKFKFPSWTPFFHKIADKFGRDRFAICCLLLGVVECFQLEDDNPSDSQSQALKDGLRRWHGERGEDDNELLQKLLQALYEAGCAAGTLRRLITGGEFPVNVVQNRRVSHNVVTMETSAVGWPP